MSSETLEIVRSAKNEITNFQMTTKLMQDMQNRSNRLLSKRGDSGVPVVPEGPDASGEVNRVEKVK